MRRRALDQRLFFGFGVRLAPTFEIGPVDCFDRFLDANDGAVER
jgi:hypothetical protein